jgi:hypothetical protein
MPSLPAPATRAPARRPRPGSRAARLLLLAAALVAVRVAEATGGAPEAEASLERAVKAAYVYNFTKFVWWPVESPFARAPVFTVGVLGDDPLADALEATLRGKRMAGRRFAVRRFRTAGDVVPCPVLYVGRGQSGSLRRLLDQLRGWPVLTVGDAGGFTSAGGVIALFPDDSRVRFEVQLAAARAAGLEVSSKLLRLSRPDPCHSCATPAAGAVITHAGVSGGGR